MLFMNMPHCQRIYRQIFSNLNKFESVNSLCKKYHNKNDLAMRNEFKDKQKSELKAISKNKHYMI